MGAANSNVSGGRDCTDECLGYIQEAILQSGTKNGCTVAITKIPENIKFAVGGGTCPMVGGLDDILISEYDTSVSSKAKREIIKKLADGISKALKVSPPPPSASNDDMVAHLLKIVPNPRKGKSIIANSEKQGRLCSDVADVINRTYGTVIDTTLGPDGICNQVSDIVESLSAGLNKEYVTVAASVDRAIQNLRELRDMLERSYSKLYGEVTASSDDSLKISVDGIESVHRLILTEVDRQLAILTNLTSSSIRPVERDLAQLLAENQDFRGLIQSIKRSVGTSEWGDKLGFWLAGINNVAQMANAVNKALSVIGMKAADYKNQHKLSNLVMKTHELMEKLPANKMTRESIEKFEKAVEILKKYHGHHDAISKEMKGGALSHVSHVPHMPRVNQLHTGGLDPLSKRLGKQKNSRRLMLDDFKMKSKILVDRMYNSIFNLAKDIGTGSVKMSDNLYQFKKTLDDMSITFREGIEFALTGYYSNANAVEHKERFLGLLREMLMVLEPLKPQASGFRDVAADTEALIKLIDFFTDKFKVYTGHSLPSRSGGGDYGMFSGTNGGGDSSDSDEEDILGGSAQLPGAAGAWEGGSAQLPGAAGGIDLNQYVNKAKSFADTARQGINQAATLANQANLAYTQMQTPTAPVAGGGEFGAAVTLRNARNTFNHFYSIAKFKANLHTVAGEMKGYNKNYETLVGSAIGREIDRIKTAVNDSKALMERASPPSMEYTSLEAIRLGARAAGGAADWYMYKDAACLPKEEWMKDDILRVQNSFAEAKIALYSVAQAVDVYLQVFTDEVSTNIDDIREVSKMLSTVNIMANWFSEKSGDSIAALYEIFPWSMRGLRTVMNAPLQRDMFGASPDNATTQLSGHYYTAIGSHIRGPTVNNTWESLVSPANSKLPANPFLPISPRRAIQAHKFAKYTLEKIMALKNIVSAFSYIGDRIGGKDIHSETFMSPGDIYKSLVDYLYISALTMGWGKTPAVKFYGADLAAGNYSLETPVIGGAVDICAAIPGGLHACATPFQGGAGGTNFTRAMGQLYGPNVVDYAAVTDDVMGVQANNNYRSIFRIAPLFGPTMCAVVECSDAAGGGPGGVDGVNFSGAINPLRAYDAGGSAGNDPFRPALHNHQSISLDTWERAPAVPRGVVVAEPLAGLTLNAAVARTRWGCAMAGIAIGDDTADSMSGWSNHFDREDGIFVNIIKAMAAKVFTVTGLYNMLNFADSRNYAMNPTRLILGGKDRLRPKSHGGGSYDTPTIHADAIELYARLPLLAEFYRDVFCFEEACTDDPRSTANPSELIISMVPEVGSMWAGFIQCIFDQPVGTNGVYTENVLKRIVHEINEVYSTFKARNPKDFVLAIITDFIAEINGRYGLMSRTDINEYRATETTRRTAYEYGRGIGEVDDFDTLDDDTRGSGVAPSERFSRVTASADSSRFDIQPSMYTALQVFRRRIDNRVRSITHTARFNVRAPSQIPDFGALIMSTRETMKTLQAPEDQFKAVVRMMTGMDVQTQNNREATLMFHEAIITPLAALASLTEMLALYEQSVREWDAYPLFKGLELTWNPQNAGGMAGGAWCVWVKQKILGAGGAAATAANTQSWATVMAGATAAFNAANAYTANVAFTEAMLYTATADWVAEMRRINGAATVAALDATQVRNLRRETTHTFSNMMHDSQSPNLTLANILDRTDLVHPRYCSTAAGRATAVALFAPPAAGANYPDATITAFRTAANGYVAGNTRDPDYGMHRHVAYLSIRWEALMQHMVQLVYGLSANLGKMCEVSFQNNKIVLNHTKLESICSEIMATIRTDIDKFRGVIPPNVIESYERVETPGSINWIQANLFDGLFADKTQRGLKRAHLIVTRNFQLLSNVYPEANQSHRVTYHGIGFLGGGDLTPHSGWGLDVAAGTVVERLQGWSVENTFSELTHYNTMTMSSSILCGSNSAGHLADNVDPASNFASIMSLQGVWTHYDAFEHLLKSPTTRTGVAGRPNPPRIYADNMFKGRHDFYLQDSASGRKDRGFRGDTCLTMTGAGQRVPYIPTTGAVMQNMIGAKTDVGEGLMMKLNEVVAAYLRQFWDVGSSRIYSPLIEGPANGPMNQAVFKAQGWPDFAPCILAGGRDMVIAATTVSTAASAGSGVTWDLGLAAGGTLTNQQFNTFGNNAAPGRYGGGWLGSFTSEASLPGGYLPGVPHNFDGGGGDNRSTGHGALSNAWHMCYPSGAAFAAFDIAACGSEPWLLRTQRYAVSAISFNMHMASLFNAAAPFWGVSVNTGVFGSKYGYNTIAVGTARELAIQVKEVTGPFAISQTNPLHSVANVLARDFGGPASYNHLSNNIPGNEQHMYVKGCGVEQQAWAAGPQDPNTGVGPVGYKAQLSRSWVRIGSFSGTRGTPVGVGSGLIDAGGYFASVPLATAIAAATPMPGTVLHQNAMFTTAYRYLHRLKNAIVHKARELNLHDLSMLRQFVYTYIDHLGEQIEAAETRRIETCIQLNPGMEVTGIVPARTYPVAGRVSRDRMDTLYRVDIIRNARFARAFIVEYVLNPYANRLFATLGTELNITGADKRTTNIADAIALSTLYCEPVTNEMAGLFNDCIQSIRYSMARMPTSNSPESGATHLGLLRSFYESGGTHALGEMYKLFANGRETPYTGAARAYLGGVDTDPQDVAAAIYGELTRSVNEYEGTFLAAGTIFADRDNSTDIGTQILGINANTPFRFTKGISHTINYPIGLTTGALSPVVTMRLLGFGMSDYVHNTNYIAIDVAFRINAANVNNKDGFGFISAIRPDATYPAVPSGRTVYPAHRDCFDKNSIIDNNGDVSANGGLFAYMLGNKVNTYGSATMGWDALAPNVFNPGVPAVAIPQNANNNGLAPITLFTLMSSFLRTAVTGYNDAVGPVDDLRIIHADENNIQEISAFPRNIGDPREVLFASTARAIFTALTETTATNVKSNATLSIADVPLRAKESMKSQLPIFHELFKMITKKADLLKGIIRLNIGLDRPYGLDEYARVNIRGVHGRVDTYAVRNQTQSSAWYAALLDRITSTSDSFISAIASTLNELNDAPLYLETSDNSITEYKNSTGAPPYMPMSTLTLFLQHPGNSTTTNPLTITSTSTAAATLTPSRDSEIGYPVYGPDSDHSRLNYGTRSLLHNYNIRPLIEHMPGMVDILAKYNMTAQGQKKIEEKTFGAYCGKIVEILRYVSSSKIYATLLGGDRRVLDNISFAPRVGAANLSAASAITFPTYQMTRTLPAAINLTVGSDSSASMGEVVGYVTGAPSTAAPISRAASMMYNILDLNISPINVHAMRKEIPLANLYNYAYTFDSFVSEIVESGVETVAQITATSTTHDMMAVLLKNPYARVDKVGYYKHVGNIAKGNSSIDLYGYPRFISDQLWNKVLLNDLVGSAGTVLTFGQLRSANRRGDLNRFSDLGITDYQAAWSGVPLGADSANRQLHFMRQDNGDTTVENVDVSTADGPVNFPAASMKGYLAELGRLRFDTKLARNMFFIANVQRIMAHKIDTELSKIHFPVVSNAAVTNRKITDYADRETFADVNID